MHPVFETLSPTLNIAHRGGASLAPENTMCAFEAAVERHRVDMIELDVRATADGRIVVFHDPQIRLPDGSERNIEGLDWHELKGIDAGHWFADEAGEHPFRGRGCVVPLLSEVLNAWPELPLNIELKSADPQLLAGFERLIRQHDSAGRVCIGSELDPVGVALLEALPECAHFYSRAPLTAFVMAALTGQAPPTVVGAQVLDMPLEHGGVRLVTPALIAAAKAAGLWINVWTIDAVDTMSELIELGVGGIMTDRPDRLQALLNN